jgi:hypothetical protein
LVYGFPNYGGLQNERHSVEKQIEIARANSDFHAGQPAVLQNFVANRLIRNRKDYRFFKNAKAAAVVMTRYAVQITKSVC